MAGSTKTAIVTGGGSGIGAAISRRLAADGARVAVLDIDGAAAEAVASSIEQVGGVAIGLALDVTDRVAIDAAVAEVRERLGAPNILVTSAGATDFGGFLEAPPETWGRMLSINVMGTVDCCKAVLPGMVDAGWGRIVTISSSSVHSGVPQLTSYVAAKSAVVGFTKSLALEFAPHGVTVNTIPPGFIDTPMLREAAGVGSLAIERSTASTPVGRPGRPEDIAAACAFLVGDDAGYVTGQIIGVNGGRNT